MMHVTLLQLVLVTMVTASYISIVDTNTLCLRFTYSHGVVITCHMTHLYKCHIGVVTSSNSDTGDGEPTLQDLRKWPSLE